MSLMRVKARWTIPGAGTAFSVFHFGDDGDSDISNMDATSAVDKVHAFYTALGMYLPNAVKIDVQADVEHLQVDTAELLGVASGGTKTTITGSAGATVNWAAPAGACITWSTAGIRTVTSKPRRVRGRTFLVPLAQNAYETDGTLAAAFLTATNQAANNLRSNTTGAPLLVYARPSETPAVVGQVYSVTGHRLSDRVAVLRSRRS